MHPEGMGWSWPDLQATPAYVKRYCWDLLQIRRRAEREAQEKATASAHRGLRRA